jgi:SAM-dependent methyltransferase
LHIGGLAETVEFNAARRLERGNKGTHVESQADDEEISAFLDRWLQSIVDRDIVAASALRDEEYTAQLDGGRLLNRQQELATIASLEMNLSDASLQLTEVRRSGDEATLLFGIEIGHDGETVRSLHRCELVLSRQGGALRARRFRLLDEGFASGEDRSVDPPRGRPSLRRLARHLPAPIRRRLKRLVAPGGMRAASPLQELGYVPYNEGADYAIMPDEARGADRGADGLPVPPQKLWLGYNYPAHGKEHVAKMLEIVSASGFSFRPGDRILDLGCGAGRMIRHLRELAETCEIWGADISADHITWCRHNLSPPFNFLTTTRHPHLPFEDRSFRFIYCGSLFTHIDDLTDAWLLELNRLLDRDGRLYATIHDRHTVALFDDVRHSSADIVKTIKAFPMFERTGPDFSFLSVGRESDPQVFYDVDYFRRRVGPAFEILSVTEEAYFYQTAILMKRR